MDNPKFSGDVGAAGRARGEGDARCAHNPHKGKAQPVPRQQLSRGGKPLERNRDGSVVVHRLRVAFQKQGRAAMLSHLEVARALERVIRRAQLPYAVTNGFSPHMRVSFGSALPVGVGSVREYLDVWLTERVDPVAALRAMQAGCPPALMVLECGYIGLKDPAASDAFPFSTYVAAFDCALPCKVAAHLPVPETVTVIRKKKEKVLRVRDYLQPDMQLQGDRLTFSLLCGANGNLRPDVLVRAIAAGMPGVRVVSITRIAQAESI